MTDTQLHDEQTDQSPTPPAAVPVEEWVERTLWRSARARLIYARLQVRRSTPPKQQALDTRQMLRLGVFGVIVLIIAALLLILPPPASVLGFILVLAASAAVVIRPKLKLGKYVKAITLPQPIRAQRNKLAFVLALTSFGLMIAATLDFHYTNLLAYLDHATIKMIVGALLLGVAVKLSSRQPALPTLSTELLNPPRKGWWLPALIGLVLLGMTAEINMRRLGIPFLQSVNVNVQIALFLAALFFWAWGMGGMPKLRLPRFNRWTVLPLLAILVFAFGVRAFGLNDTLRSLVDELHFTDGVQRIFWVPDLPMLTSMSGQAPFTWLYAYTEYLTIFFTGFDLAGVRGPSVIFGVAVVALTYGLARALLDDRKTALLCALMLAGFAPFIHYSRTALLHIGDPLAGGMALMFAARGLRSNRRIDWALAGIGLGLTQYFYEGARLLFFPLMIAWMIGLLIVQRGKMRPLLKGIGVMFITSALVTGLYYAIILNNNEGLSERMNDSGLGSEYWENILQDGISADDLHTLSIQFTRPFASWVAHRDLSAYYGGSQALIVDYLIPFFLFGAFYLFWRLPSQIFIVPLWLVATGLGNGLLRDNMVSVRYVLVLPAMAIAIAAGIRYLIPFIWTRQADTLPEAERPPENRLRYAIPVVLVGFFAVAQVQYYYGPHLAEFNVQIRDFKAYRDGVDVALRAAELPWNTQTIIVGRPQHDTGVPRALVGYFRHGEVNEHPPLLSLRVDEINPRSLMALVPGQNYAYFVEADDTDTMRLLMRYLPGISPPQFSLTAAMPAHREYVLLYYPATAEPPRPPTK